MKLAEIAYLNTVQSRDQNNEFHALECFFVFFFGCGSFLQILFDTNEKVIIFIKILLCVNVVEIKCRFLKVVT